VRVGWDGLRGGSGQDFSNSCGCGAGLNLAGTGRVRTQNFNPRRTLLSTYATLTWAHKCNQLFLILHKIHSQVRTNTTCTKLRERPHITSSDRGEGGLSHQIHLQLLHHMKVKITLFQTNYTTMKTYLWTTWSSNRLLLGWLQVNSVSRLITRFMLIDCNRSSVVSLQFPFTFIVAGTTAALWR